MTARALALGLAFALLTLAACSGAHRPLPPGPPPEYEPARGFDGGVPDAPAK